MPVELIIAWLEERLGVTAERRVVETLSGRYSVSLAKLRRLLPSISALGFGPGYYRTVIDRYLGYLEAVPRPERPGQAG